MKKLFFILPLVLLLSACGNITVIEPIITEPSPKIGTEMSMLNTEWNTYNNYDLGFSIQVPRYSDYFSGEMQSSRGADTIIFGDKENASPITFKIFHPQQESDIDAIIQANLGSGLTWTKTSIQGTGNFILQAMASGYALPINKIRYSSSKKLLILWIIGQEPNFFFQHQGLDTQVSQSFKFIQ